MKRNPLREIEGVRIRRQYFGFLVVGFLATGFLTAEIMAISALKDGSFTLLRWCAELLTVLFVILIFLLPCLLLLFLNRHFFGRTVCVFDERGIHYKDGFIPWERITALEYHITHTSRHRFRPSYVDVICGEERIIVKSMPLYALRIARSFRPALKTKIESAAWIALAVIFVFGIWIPLCM